MSATGSGNAGIGKVAAEAGVIVSDIGGGAVTRSLAIEYASRGVRVNAVSLGVIRTPMHGPESCEAIAELALHPFGAERLGAGDAGRVEHERGGPASGELGDAAQRVGVRERSLNLGFGDGVSLAGFAAAGVADGLLALRVGPAGAVGDQSR